MEGVITLIVLLSVVYLLIYLWFHFTSGIKDKQELNKISIALLAVFIFFSINLMTDNIYLNMRLYESGQDFWKYLLSFDIKNMIAIIYNDFSGYIIVYGIIWLIISYLVVKDKKKSKVISDTLIGGLFMLIFLIIGITGLIGYTINYSIEQMEKYEEYNQNLKMMEFLKTGRDIYENQLIINNPISTIFPGCTKDDINIQELGIKMASCNATGGEHSSTINNPLITGNKPKEYFYTIEEAKIICPGNDENLRRLPTKDEWTDLVGLFKGKLSGSSIGEPYNIPLIGNEGYHVGVVGYYWTSTNIEINGKDIPYIFAIYKDTEKADFTYGTPNGYSVRCIKNI